MEAMFGGPLGLHERLLKPGWLLIRFEDFAKLVGESVDKVSDDSDSSHVNSSAMQLQLRYERNCGCLV